MLKRLKYAIMLNLLPPLVYLFLLALRATIRIEHVNKDVSRLFREKEGALACFWHGRLLAMPFAYEKGGKLKVLISRHRDGEFIARIVSYFGIGTVRGSYRKGAVSSVREILAELKRGTTIAITPDGPKGPRHQIKPGVIEIARITQRPIIPVTYSANRKKVFASWDEFVLPYPFARVLFLWGNPIHISRDLDKETIEATRLFVEKTLISLNEQADAMVCGR